jgi:hypothetical protein
MIEIKVDGRLVLTTEQAVECSDRWPNTAALRSWIDRNDVEPAAELGPLKLYYPEDLGLEES